MIPKKNLSNRLKKLPHIRIALVAAVASILLVSGIAAIGLPKASAKSEIHATGTITQAAPQLVISTQTVGDLEITTRAHVSTYVGGLDGTLGCTVKRILNTVTGVQHASAHCSFTGTVGDSQKGVMSKIYSFTNDPDYLGTPAVGSSLWMAGAGGLEGICGEGDFWTAGGVTYYDYTFRFGKDCKANN